MSSAQCRLENRHLVVVGIDIGTSYSGYAFSFREDYSRNPALISTNNWSAREGTSFSHKAPTSVLLKPNMAFDCFGYEAESKFADLAQNEENASWFFIREFKMHLHSEKLQRHLLIKDIHGKFIPAEGLFTEAIKYLKNHLQQEFRSRGLQNFEGSTKYVVTVPAIWTDAAKQVMHEAAMRAGIKIEDFTLAYEPECAALFCTIIPKTNVCGETKTDSKYLFQPGKKFMVLDLGGGTADITVQELATNGRFRQIHKVSGGPWGGSQVNKAFFVFLCRIFGEKIFLKFCRESMSDFLYLEREFEIKKRDVTPTSDAPIRMHLPVALKEIYQEDTGLVINQTIRNSCYHNLFDIKRDTVTISADIFKGFFADTVSKILSHVRSVLTSPTCHGVSTILMVGGFSESKMVSERVREMFTEMEVIVPYGCGLSVLQGAVLFGHNPSFVRTRVCPYTFGIALDRKFRNGVDPENLAYTKGKTKYVSGCFEKIFTVNEIIEVGDKRTVPVVDKAHAREKPKSIEVYRSTSADPGFITDENVWKNGEILIPPPGGKWPETIEGNIEIEIGGTEMIVRYIDIDRKLSASCSINFLEDNENEEQSDSDFSEK